MGGISEMARESTEFLAYAKKMLTTAHQLHNKMLISRDNALVLKKKQRCPFCRDKLYGPCVGDGEVQGPGSDGRLAKAGRPCLIKKDRPPQNGGYYFPTGCNQKLKLSEVKAGRLMELISLDATKPRVEFINGFGIFDVSKDSDPDYSNSDSDDEMVTCCGKSCGQRCDIRNFPGFGDTWSY